jgi:hypothetical protein
MTPEDRANLEREARELFSGQETLADYSRDVQNILNDIIKRTAADNQVKQKIEKSMPIEQKSQSPSSILDGFAGLLRQMGDQFK